MGGHKEWMGRPGNLPAILPGRRLSLFCIRGGVVIDNPPFSILAEIVNFYNRQSIEYFLFCPGLTGVRAAPAYIGTGYSITYENGAKISTSFISSKGPILMSAPDLYAALEAADKTARKKNKKLLPVYGYPDNLIMPTTLNKFSKYGVAFEARAGYFCRKLDAQIPYGKAIYGGGYLVSEGPAKRAQEEAKRAQEEARRITFELSEREKGIVKNLR